MSDTWPDLEGIRRPVIVQLPPELRKPGLSIGRVILLTFIFLGLQVGLGMIVGFVGAVLRYPYAEMPLVFGLINVCSFLLVVPIGAASAKMGLGEVLALRPVSLILFFPMSITMIGLTILLSELNNVVLRFIPIPAVVSDFLEKLFTGGSDGNAGGIAWQTIVLLCAIAPITEEILFRGLMLNGLRQRHHAVIAVLVSSVLFAFFHLNPWQAGPALVLGILFGWWLLRTGSLWPCLFGHALNNGLVACAALLPFHIPGYNSSPAEGPTFQPLWFDMTGLALTVVGISMTALLFRRMPKGATACAANAPIMAREIVPLVDIPPSTDVM